MSGFRSIRDFFLAAAGRQPLPTRDVQLAEFKQALINKFAPGAESATVMERMEETPMEGSARTNTILSLSARGELKPGAAWNPKATDTREAATLRTTIEYLVGDI